MPNQPQLEPHTDGLYNAIQGLPTHTEGLYNAIQGLPTPTEGLYNAVQGLPTHTEGLSNAIQGLVEQKLDFDAYLSISVVLRLPLTTNAKLLVDG